MAVVACDIVLEASDEADDSNILAPSEDKWTSYVSTLVILLLIRRLSCCAFGNGNHCKPQRKLSQCKDWPYPSSSSTIAIYMYTFFPNNGGLDSETWKDAMRVNEAQEQGNRVLPSLLGYLKSYVHR